jgi:predicted ATP-grasp superfamily ATP-dependent carboligase
MRVFLYEALCAGAPADLSSGGSLRSEGWAMLSALIEDFSLVPGVEVVWLADTNERLEPFLGLPIRRGNVEPVVTTKTEEPTAFRKLAGESDYSLVTAPEFGGFLRERCSWVEEVGGRLLGPNPEAVRLTSDKLELATHLRKYQIPTPACFLPKENGGCPFPAILKPRDGAGSQATILVACEQELERSIRTVRSEGWVGELLLQPFAAGFPCSISFLMGDKQIVSLLPASQEFTSDDRFVYQGGILPLSPPLAERAVHLGSQAVRSIPGLRGYVGVDLILAVDSVHDQVIEINPRLTTSYVGLRALAKTNLAEAMIQIAEGKHGEALEWGSGKLRFWQDGRIKPELQ